MLRARYYITAVVLAVLVSCSAENLNADIPADPNVAPPPPVSGNLIPTITLGETRASNPGRVSLVVGGVGYQGAGEGFEVVEYTQDNLTIVEDGVVQGKLLSEGSRLSVDVVFVIDNTSSMTGEIAGVRSSVLQFVDVLRAGGQDVRAGVVAFNDGLSDDFANDVDVADRRAKPAIYGFRDLSEDLSEEGELYSFVATLPAADLGNNRDFPELAFAGLDFARRTLSWRDTAQRVYILITDDSAWGRGYSGSANDKGIDPDYFTDQSLGISLRDEGSVVHVYSPTPKSETALREGEYNVKPLADLTGGIWNELDRSGEFDLLELGITDVTLASTRVEFVKNGDPEAVVTRRLRVAVQVEDEGAVYGGERTIEVRY